MMAVDLVGFPVGNIVDGVLSYIQHLFSTPDITPSSVRWNSNSRKSKIRISGSFSTDNERSESSPYIIVERGPFSFANRAIDNLKTATPNTFDESIHTDWMDGHINITCGSSIASEASSLANFIAICMQADRHSIQSTLSFVRHISYIDIGPEDPVKADSETYAWEVTLRVKTSVYVGWVSELKTKESIFERALIYGENSKSEHKSNTGMVEIGSPNLIDTSANFGTYNDSVPQLLESELNSGWYSVVFDGSTQRHEIKSIVNTTTIELEQVNSDNNNEPFNPETSESRPYSIVWNSIRIKAELPNKTTL